MRFEELRKQISTISQGGTIQEQDQARSIVTQMIAIGLAEPPWRQRAAEIFAHWCEIYSKQMPYLLQTVWEARKAEVETRQQQQQQRTKTAIARKKELNQDIERLILIVAIQRLLTDSRHAAAIQVEQARQEAETMQEKAAKLETTLQERVTRLKGSIS